MWRCAMRPELYSPLSVDSWPQKLMKPFCTLKVGLTAGSKSWSWGHTPECSAETESQVPCGPGKRNVFQVFVWVWRNEYISQITYCEYLRNIIHWNPPLPLVLRNTPPPRRPGGTAPKYMNADNKFGRKSSPFGGDNRDIGIQWPGFGVKSRYSDTGK